MFHRPRPENKQPENKKKEQMSGQQKSFADPKGMMSQQETIAIQETIAAKKETIMNKEQQDSLKTEGQSMETTTTASFQRPPQMQRTMPAAGFSGSYPAAAAQSYEAHNSDKSRLVIGKGITMSGEIEACDHLMVEGTLEAALKGARVLEIAETGVFYGAVEIEEATVAGRFEGDLTVNGRLTIKEGGSVTGSVAYKELAIEAGAVLDGKVSPLASMGMAKAKTETPKAKKAMAPKNDNEGENGKEELPFTGDAVAAAE